MKTLIIAVLLLSIATAITCQAGELEDSLTVSAGYGSLEQVQDLVRRGADVDGISSFGQTPLKVAARNGHYEVVRYLLQQGADPNLRSDFGSTALIAAANAGQVKTVDLLLAKGADPFIKDGFGMTAFRHAKVAGHSTVADHIETQQAYVKLCAQFWNAAYTGKLRTAKRALQRGANVNYQIKSGATALMHASYRGKIKTVEFLLENGADTSILSKKGNSALSVAVEREHTDIVKALIKSGAKVTPAILKIAKEQRNKEIASIIEQAGEPQPDKEPNSNQQQKGGFVLTDEDIRKALSLEPEQSPAATPPMTKTTGQPTAKTLGITMSQVLYRLNRYFPEIKSGAPADGQAKWLGSSKEALAMIEMYGNKTDLTSATLSIAFHPGMPKQQLTLAVGIMWRFLKNLCPDSDKPQTLRWIFQSTDTLFSAATTSRIEGHQIYSSKKPITETRWNRHIKMSLTMSFLWLTVTPR